VFFLVMYKGDSHSCSRFFPSIFVAERQRGYNMCKSSAGFGVIGYNGCIL
jgi:hypothetical protein